MCRVENKNIIKVFWAQRRHLWCLNESLHDDTRDPWATLPQKKKASWMYVCTLPKRREKHEKSVFPRCTTKCRWNTTCRKAWKSLRFACVFFHKRLQRFCSTHVPLGFRAKTLKTTTLFHHFARKGRPFHQNLPLAKYNIIIKESQRRGTGIWAAIRAKGSGARGAIPQRTAPTKHLNFSNPL